MKNLKNWYYPTSVKEALELLAGGDGQVKVIGGGTALAESRDPNVEGLVDITRIPELRMIERLADGTLVIGAAVTARDIMCSKALPPLVASLLGAAVATISHRMHRNVITVGGNIVQLYAWSDMPVALVALDARYRLEAAGGETRWLSAEELVAQHPHKILHWKELLTQVHIPPSSATSGGAFLKFSRTESDYAFATAAARVDLDEKGRVSECRAVVGGAVPRPIRLTALEAQLRGQVPDVNLVEGIAAQVKDHVTPTADFRASVEYRTELCTVLVKRALMGSFEQAKAAGPEQGRLE